MNAKQDAKLIDVLEAIDAKLERIASALEQAQPPLTWKQEINVSWPAPEDVQTRAITARPIKYVWPKTTAGEGLLR